jgi:hypothetical protein
MSQIIEEIMDILQQKNLLNGDTLESTKRLKFLSELMQNLKAQYKERPSNDLKLQGSTWFSMQTKEVLKILSILSNKPENKLLCGQLFDKLRPRLSPFKPYIHSLIKQTYIEEFSNNDKISELVAEMDKLQIDITSCQLFRIKNPENKVYGQMVYIQIELLKSYYCAILVLINKINPNHRILKIINF